MDHCGVRVLETERLILRPFVREDAALMYRNWASDDEVTRFLTWPTHAGTDVTEQVLEDWVQHYASDDFYQWAIVLKSSGEPIGSGGAVSLDESVGLVHIGYCIGRPWWGQGLTAEALHAMIDYFFDVVGADCIQARHDPRNPNSGRVMQKCGMKYDGTLRACDRNNQGVCDASYYSLLRSER